MSILHAQQHLRMAARHTAILHLAAEQRSHPILILLRALRCAHMPVCFLSCLAIRHGLLGAMLAYLAASSR